MAALVIAAAGSAIGGTLITGTVLGLSGATIGYVAGSLLASALVKPPNQSGPRLGDLRVSGTEYGAPIPFVAGGPRIAGQVVWASKRETANTQSVGKGGGGSFTSYTYDIDLLILLTENEIEGVSRIWSNGELVYNGLAKEGLWGSLAVYTGAPDQLPDPTYEAAVGAGNAPAYRGRGYVVISGLQLGGGGQIPNLTFEVGRFALSSWVSRPGAPNASSWRAVAYGNGVFVAVATGGTGERIMTSADGLNWTARTGGEGFQWSAVAFGQGVFVAVAFGRVIYSTDGATWNVANVPAGNGRSWSSVAYGGGVFVAVAEGSVPGDARAMSSPDGVNWTYRNCPVSDWRGVCYGGSGFVAVAFSNPDRVMTSPDGIAWTPRAVAWTNNWTSVAFGDGRYVAVSSGGLGNFVMTSPDGVTWTSRAAPVNGWTSVAYGDGGFVAVAQIGSVGLARTMSSPDGLTWQSKPSSNDAFSWGSIAFGARRFVAVAGGGSGLPDGKTMTIGFTRQEYTQEIAAVSASLLTRSGYAPEDFDTAALASITRPVRGMALGQVSSTRGALETLQTGYFFDVSKSDKIRFAPRSVTPVVDIPFADLGTASDPSGSEDPLGLVVGNELEVPAQVSLSYHNTAGDYNVATEHSDRLLSGQETNQVVQLGLGLLPAEAKGVADGLLVDQIASLTRTTLRLPLKYAYLEPGDVFTVTNADGRQYRLRSQSKRDTLTILEHECVMDDAGALTSAQITSSNYALTETVRQIAPTIWEAMDIPLLRDADNSAGFYVALAPNRAAPVDQWPGGVFLRSWSADAYDEMFSIGDPCTMGATVGALGSFDSSGRFDERNTVTVRVTGQLANTTRADMLDSLGVNAALVGNEIVRFRLAEFLGTVDGENEYRLSGLLRGQRGTEQHMGTHAAGERFVLLNASLRRVVNQTSEIGVASQVKAVTFNSLLSGVTAKAFTDTGVGLRPLSVAGLRCLRSGSGLALSWHRRTRLSYRYGGTVGASVPLGEVAESYRVEVYDGPTLARTYTTSSNTFSYSSALMLADGFGSGDTISFVVRQVSSVVGPGFPASISSAAPATVFQSTTLTLGGVATPSVTLTVYAGGASAVASYTTQAETLAASAAGLAAAIDATAYTASAVGNVISMSGPALGPVTVTTFGGAGRVAMGSNFLTAPSPPRSASRTRYVLFVSNLVTGATAQLPAGSTISLTLFPDTIEFGSVLISYTTPQQLSKEAAFGMLISQASQNSQVVAMGWTFSGSSPVFGATGEAYGPIGKDALLRGGGLSPWTITASKQETGLPGSAVPVAQAIEVSVIGDVDPSAGDVFTIILNGTNYSVTAGPASTKDTVSAALADAINGASFNAVVSASSSNRVVILITSTTANLPFSYNTATETSGITVAVAAA